MSEFAHIKRCFELSDEDVAHAIESREDTRELLAHLAKIAQPNSGAAKILLIFARMATNACEWLDGDLRVDIVGQKDGCTVHVVDDLGVGMAERVFPPFVLPVPLDEFLRALERVPERIQPLGITARGKDRVTLGATAEIRRSSLPPPAVKIADDSFFVGAIAKPPKVPEAMVPSSKVPALPIVNAALPLVTEERVGRRKSTRPARPEAKAPPEPKLPVVSKAPSEAMIPVIAPSPKRAPSKRPPPPAKKSAPPPARKSVAPKKSISPLAGIEDEQAIDTGWEDE